MTAKSHRVLWLGLWLTFAATSEVFPAALTPEELYQKVLPSVMTLEVENQYGERFVGSAVLAIADDVALTAWHVVADASSVWAVFSDGQRVKAAGCIAHDGGRDLALLKLEKRLPHRRAVLAPDQPSVAARAYVIGAPKGYEFSISDGLISQIRRVDDFLQYQLSCPISPGNSGSPVFNQRGEVIAIASWTKTDAQNVSFAIPIQEFIGLDASQPPKSWTLLAASTPSAAPARLTTSRHTSGKALEKTADAANFAAFKQWLKDSVGKSVTVVVQKEGRTNTYMFTVE